MPATHPEIELPGPGPDDRNSRPSSLRSRAWWIAAVYGVFATLWIYYSDRALALTLTDPERLDRYSVYKGIGFVAITMILLFVLMRKAFGAIETGYASLQVKERQLEESEARLASIVRSATDAIVTVDGAQRIVLFNAAAEKMFGCPEATARGQPIEHFLPTRFDANGESRLLLTGRRNPRDEFPLEASISRIETGNRKFITVILRDIGERQAHEIEVERLKRLYAALSQINQAIVRTPTRAALFQKVCEVLVKQGEFRMAWIGWHDSETHQLVPVAECGDENGYVQSIKVFTDERPEGGAPSGIAFREGRSSICNDMLNDPATLPWRPEIVRRGFRASAVMPIRMKDQVRGTLNVYADEVGFFQDKEITLLSEAAVDLSYALDNLARDEERQRAEAIALSERHFSDTMIESMPGILYFYNEQGRFLRWNKNFEIISGYSAGEIAAMHPLDFFSRQERASLEKKVAEVFEHGESFLEAQFVARDGTATPYFFTGRRVLFEGNVCLVGVGIDMTERKRAESALRASEERFHAFMDATPAITWVTDEGGRHLYMNRAWDQAFGLNRAEWIGKTAFDMVPNEAAEKIRRSDEEVLRQNRAIEIAGDNGELRGKPFHWDCIKFPFRNGAGQRFIGGIAIDITKRKQAESALRELQQQFEVVVENLSEGLVIADLAENVIHWNPAAIMMLGFEQPEEGRRRLGEFSTIFELSSLSGVLLPSDQWPLARVRRGEQFVGLEARVQRVGTDWERLFSYSGASVRYAGVKNLAFLTITDITDRKRAERVLRNAHDVLELKVVERTSELQTARARAESADRIKSAFLATMSHELRTPLNSIIGFTGIVLQGLAGPLNPEQTKQLGMVRGSARHLLELINDVLDLSKIEAGQLEINSEPFALPPSIERVLASVKLMADKKNLTVSATVAPNVGEMINDRRRVEQILINLLNNAIKFTESGSVKLTATIISDYRGSSTNLPQPAVLLRVADTGSGIKSNDLATLFLPFRQIDTGLARQHEGTGLGLAICRRLAGLMGGEISATSEWTKGSEFTVVLPLHYPPTP